MHRTLQGRVFRRRIPWQGAPSGDTQKEQGTGEKRLVHCRAGGCAASGKRLAGRDIQDGPGLPVHGGHQLPCPGGEAVIRPFFPFGHQLGEALTGSRGGRSGPGAAREQGRQGPSSAPAIRRGAAQASVFQRHGRRLRGRLSRRARPHWVAQRPWAVVGVRPSSVVRRTTSL